MENVSSSNGLEKRPKLRFPGFDEPWEENELSHYLVENTERNRGLAFGKEDVLSVSGEYGVINQIAFQGRSFAGESVADYHVVETDDIVYTKSPLKANPYGIIKVNKGIPGIVSTLYAVYHPLNTVAPRFVDLYFANNLRLNKFLKPLVNIGAKHDMKVNNSFVLTGTVVFPSIGEQQKLVDFFAKLDRRIEAQRKIVEALKKYKRGVTAKLIAAIEEKYPVVRLGDHVTVMRGGSPRPIDAYITNAENGIRWIKIGDALPDQLYISDTKEKIKPEGAKKSRRVYAGDLILSNSMSFGRPYILKVDGCIHDGWLLIRDEEKKFDKRFLCFYLASDVTLAQYKKYAAGSCVNNLNSELVASVEIGMPPIEQQIRMANILEKIDRQVEAASTMYLLLSKLRSSLLQQLFI
ncbi:restriction endonuclease subunit S [Gemmiger formicilis]|uniref:restriction endonuclease subunit S n=1 Tax=Gemmiger formicilis TaxID=745368 RepID=UPI003996B360